MLLLKKFIANINTHQLFEPKDTLLLAVSGGVDSVVLCELCKQANFSFVIAHCNFKLRNINSDNDEKFVANLASQYNVPFYSTRFNTPEIAKIKKKSIEETARDLRYNWFNNIIQKKESNINWIVTAHHANDNVETLLMNFFRGTGIKGLHGILPKQNKIIRPLLFAKKQILVNFANENNLNYVLDYTNEQNDFTRNYFRNSLIPSISKVFVGVEDNLINNILKFNEIEQIYNISIQNYKQKLIEEDNNEIKISILKLLKTPALSTILYEIINPYNFTSHQINDVINLLHSQSGKFVQSSTHRIINNRKWLIITPNKSTETQYILINKNDSTINYLMGKLSFKTINPSNNSLTSNALVAQINLDEIHFPLLLRKYKQGDYFYPLGMNKKKKKLSKFLIDLKFSTTQKENTWVIENNKKIVWVIGLRIDERFKITPKTKSILQIKMQAN